MKGKLAQRKVISNGHIIDIGLINDVGYLCVEDNNLYPDTHSGAERRDLGFHTMLVPLMSRSHLKELRTAIDEVLKKSK